MRIAEVAPRGLHPTSGVTSVVARLSIELSRLGHHVELWRMSPWHDGLLVSWSHRLEEAGVVAVDARSDVGFDPIRRSVDVVHLHNVFNVHNSQLSRRLEQPYVITTHGGYSPEQLAFHRWRKTLYKHFAELRLLRRANGLVALTDVERTEIAKFGGVHATVIPNGVDRPYVPDPTSFRRTLGIGSAPLAAYAGRVDLHQKRLDDVVRALASAPRWHLLIVGGDFRGGRHQLERLALDLGVSDRLHLWDAMVGPAYHEALAAADVFVLISRWEGQSMALLEAMSLGVPAIVSAEVERRTPVAARGAGWLANPLALGETLIAVGAAPAENVSRGQRARETVRDFTWPRSAEAYLELFRSVSGR